MISCFAIVRSDFFKFMTQILTTFPSASSVRCTLNIFANYQDVKTVTLSMLTLSLKPCCVLIRPPWAARTAVECCGSSTLLLQTAAYRLTAAPSLFFYLFIHMKPRRWEINNNCLWCHDRRSVLFLFSSSPGEATVSEVYTAEHDCFRKAAQKLQTSWKQYITVRSLSCLQIKALSVSVFKSVFMDRRIPAASYTEMNRMKTFFYQTFTKVIFNSMSFTHAW